MKASADVCYNVFVWLLCVPTLIAFSASEQVLACLIVVVVISLMTTALMPVLSAVMLIITGFAMMIAGVSLPGLGKVVGILGAVLSSGNAYMLTTAVERQYSPVCV